jgi:hypothetical protein
MIVQMPLQREDESGRFGNQLFSFFFLKRIESELGCEIRYPNWLGNMMFNLPETGPILPFDESVNFEPQLGRDRGSEAEIKAINSYREREIEVLELKGSFQYHTSTYVSHRHLFLNLFKFSEFLEEQFLRSLTSLGLADHSIVSVHVRRGDYLGFENKHPLFWGGSFDAIERALSDLGLSSFKKYVIYLCSDDTEFCKRELESRNIPFITNANVFIDLDPTTQLIADFIMMAKSSALIISNSSLSFAAAMLNQRARIFLRPCPKDDTYIPFDPWNSHVLLPKFPFGFK